MAGPPSQIPTAASTTTGVAQSAALSAVVPLTTTFAPPASCLENHLTYSSPDFLIWVNEPVPATNQTSSACYPSEFLQHYTSVPSSSKGSSIVAAMSPLVCPSHHCTANVGASNYAVCCPFGWGFHPPDTTTDNNRPGYGGVCFSSLTESSIYTVTAYDMSGRTSLAFFTASTSDQAFAHPIDGFAASTPTLGCAATPKQLSNTTIAGAAIGASCGLIALIALIWFLLRYLRNGKRPPLPPPKIRHIDHDFLKSQLSAEVYEKDANSEVLELDGCEKPGNRITYVQQRKSQLNDGHGPYEMSNEPLPDSKNEGEAKRWSSGER
ncbi:hypothetical protein BDV96DRAFT_653303 [Lophiotrema nucula]|uniref:Uncharacterized protein n=1 Tax=Lophiotrema nucula TaxID=690887 RepID=A0A6A5YNX8_9PLEO|nr:hypothetical protein BDV96DRAFT_653303 [Lophiotrema nucula]